ncbi:hypothetical protein BN946_scf184965.g19 [Trametes cinnabarina]|uniref:Uncharacterized protein n=2 Tax=Pycnoporus cinnabarinus TaxID=5643 RepID=A0A060SKH4_PYCCI|nr:hypothetical protein BN946_scf184965.g19 [Trametes cinnabarina]
MAGIDGVDVDAVAGMDANADRVIVAGVDTNMDDTAGMGAYAASVEADADAVRVAGIDVDVDVDADAVDMAGEDAVNMVGVDAVNVHIVDADPADVHLVNVDAVDVNAVDEDVSDACLVDAEAVMDAGVVDADATDMHLAEDDAMYVSVDIEGAEADMDVNARDGSDVRPYAGFNASAFAKANVADVSSELREVVVICKPKSIRRWHKTILVHN